MIDLVELAQKVILFLPKVISALVIFFVALISSRLAAQWVRRLVARRIAKPEVLHLVEWPVRWAIIALGTLTALEQVDFDVSAFLAGLGVAGLTIGFALQDIARNFIAGVLLLIRQPFAIGDAVCVAGYTGKVIDVNTRDTTIQTWDGEFVVLPNLQVFSGPIIDYSVLANRRRTMRIGLGYAQDIDAAREVFLEATRSVPGVLADPSPMIHAEEFGDYAVTLALRFWINQREHSILDVHSDVIVAVNQAASQHGIDLPYPMQTVRVVRD